MGTITDRIADHARSTPDKVALRDGSMSLTYAALDPLVTRSALALRADGIQQQEIVGVCLPDTIDQVVLLLALARLGAIILPMDYRWTEPEAERIITRFEVSHVLAAPARGLPDAVTPIRIDAAWHERVRAQPDTAADFPHHETLGLVLSMSSGTTGMPKGPLASHAAQLTRARTGLITVDDVVLIATPLYFGGGRNFTLGGLLQGATVVLCPPPAKAEDLVAVANREGATYTFLVPTQMRRLLQFPDDGRLLFPTLRLLVSSGAVLFADECAAVMRRLSPNLVNLYSSTEGGGVAMLSPNHPSEKAGSVGKVFPLVRVQIVDHADHVLPNGETGRIRQQSPNTALEFFNNPDETARHFRDGWFYPGDLGWLDDDGFLYLAGRSKEMIIRGGVNIYPGEVEEPLLRLPEIHDCAAVAWPSPEMGEEVALFVVPAQPVTEEQIMMHCRSLLTRYKLPRQIFLIDDLPKNGHGKVLRAALTKRLPVIPAS